jgi:hypothetical protein
MEPQGKKFSLPQIAFGIWLVAGVLMFIVGSIGTPLWVISFPMIITRWIIPGVFLFIATLPSVHRRVAVALAAVAMVWQMLFGLILSLGYIFDSFDWSTFTGSILGLVRIFIPILTIISISKELSQENAARAKALFLEKRSGQP